MVLFFGVLSLRLSFETVLRPCGVWGSLKIKSWKRYSPPSFIFRGDSKTWSSVISVVVLQTYV